MNLDLLGKRAYVGGGSKGIGFQSIDGMRQRPGFRDRGNAQFHARPPRARCS